MVRLLLVLLVAVSPLTTERSPAPIASAAQPAAPQGDLTFARRGAEALRRHLEAMGEPDALPTSLTPETAPIALPEANLVAGCLRAEGEENLVLCHYGHVADRPLAQAIFWRADDQWQWQLYPQVGRPVASERRLHFAHFECTFGCHGALRQARAGSAGDVRELLVVADLGVAGGIAMEEPHLLRFVHGLWQAVWAPAPGDWNWGHARVTLGRSGLQTLRVRGSSWWRVDRLSGYLAEPPGGPHRWFEERWVRTGDSYILRDQVEEPSPFAALVRLIHYLNTSDDGRAHHLMDPALELEVVRQALRGSKKGWGVNPSPDGSFLLDRDGDGQPDLHLTFAQGAEGWRLVSLVPAPGRR